MADFISENVPKLDEIIRIGKKAFGKGRYYLENYVQKGLGEYKVLNGIEDSDYEMLDSEGDATECDDVSLDATDDPIVKKVLSSYSIEELTGAAIRNDCLIDQCGHQKEYRVFDWFIPNPLLKAKMENYGKISYKFCPGCKEQAETEMERQVQVYKDGKKD